jgi:hypothetical protein
VRAVGLGSGLQVRNTTAGLRDPSRFDPPISVVSTHVARSPPPPLRVGARSAHPPPRNRSPHQPAAAPSAESPCCPTPASPPGESPPDSSGRAPPARAPRRAAGPIALLLAAGIVRRWWGRANTLPIGRAVTAPATRGGPSTVMSCSRPARHRRRVTVTVSVGTSRRRYLQAIVDHHPWQTENV